MSTPAAPKKGFPWIKTGWILLALLVTGLLVWGAWQYVGTGFVARDRADKQIEQLRNEWAQSEPADPPELLENPEAGDPVWLLTIPRLGTQRWPVTVGVTSPQAGVGWYEQTAQAGQLGNVALSGNRLGMGAPFSGLESLKEGDQVVLETKDATYIYSLMSDAGQLTVKNTDTWVLEPVPGRPDQEPAQGFLTLISHEDVTNTEDRAVVFCRLITTNPK